MKSNAKNKILDSTQPTQYSYVSLKVPSNNLKASSDNPKVLSVLPRLLMVPKLFLREPSKSSKKLA